MALLSLFFSDWWGAGRKRRRGFWLAAFTLSSFLATTGWGQAEYREDQLKAVFLFNFAQFVEWPPTAFANAKSPLIIGVLGDDPFGPTLDETVRGEKIGGRKLTVRHFRHPEEIGVCHILFIGQSESSRLESIVSILGGRGILTVSDADRAARRGVMIWFFTENKKIRLRINLDAAKLAGLTISSKLLRSVEIVTSEKN